MINSGGKLLSGKFQSGLGIEFLVLTCVKPKFWPFLHQVISPLDQRKLYLPFIVNMFPPLKKFLTFILTTFFCRFYWILYIILFVLLPINAPLEYWDDTVQAAIFVAFSLRYLIVINVSWLINSAHFIWALDKNHKQSDSNMVFIVTKR